MCPSQATVDRFSQDAYARAEKEALAAQAGAAAPPERRFLGTLSSEERKKYPVTTGFLDYFPDATAMVSHVSWHGNNKHNPGQDLHWARGKSMDHPDCIGRHLIERGGGPVPLGKDGEMMHKACLAWRAMADLQEAMEKEYDLSPPRGSIPSR